MNGLKFPLLRKNTFYCYTLCVTSFSVHSFELSEIFQFGDLDLLKTSEKWNLWNIYYPNWFWLCNVCMNVNIDNILKENNFSYKEFLILALISKEDHSTVDEIWLFWTAVIGSWTVFHCRRWKFCTHRRQCAR